MEFSIVVPAFNKAQLTRNCLHSLQQTIGGYDGEVIVVDNASTDETPQILQEFPWVRVIRNDVNCGFAAANNQAARIANGRYLVLLNNDTQALPGWLDAMLKVAREESVGAVGARLVFPNGTLQHAGVVAVPAPFGISSFTMVHDLYGVPADDLRALQRRELQAVTGACLLTPREVYSELGGLDESFSNGCEDVDYCLRLRERGLRVIYEPRASLLHFESRSGASRWRRTAANNARLAERWNDRVILDGIRERHARVNVLVHGDVQDRERLERMLRAANARVERIAFATEADAIATARELMEVRGERYLAFVDARANLLGGWLDELLRQVERDPRAGASVSADARCTLLALRKFPQHHRLPDAESLDDALAAFLLDAWRELQLGVCAPGGALGDPQLAERILLERKIPDQRPLVSIVTLSWNAPEFTKLAIESIRAHTTPPYEIIIVDNGSRAETTDWLRTLEGVRVIFNDRNRGFAEGNNQGFAAARGRFIVMLNNDVIVTRGWLDGLLGAFDRIPGLGVSAPRSNKVAGDQQINDCAYNDVDAMHRYANERRKRLQGSGYFTDRAIGLCLCIDRRVIDEVGGIDPRFGIGNFEDDDFCMRVRGAGYKIYVCDDVFIHHFGSQTFAANKIDYLETMRENWRKFADKWGYTNELGTGYQPRLAIAQGFDARKHFVPLPAQTPVDDRAAGKDYRVILAASVENESDWTDVAAMVRKCVRAFTAGDPVLFTICAMGAIDAQTIGDRVERLVEKAGVALETAADIEVTDEPDIDAWLQTLHAPQIYCAGGRAATADARLERLPDRSPSGLQRLLVQTEVPA